MGRIRNVVTSPWFWMTVLSFALVGMLGALALGFFMEVSAQDATGVAAEVAVKVKAQPGIADGWLRVVHDPRTLTFFASIAGISAVLLHLLRRSKAGTWLDAHPLGIPACFADTGAVRFLRGTPCWEPVAAYLSSHSWAWLIGGVCGTGISLGGLGLTNSWRQIGTTLAVGFLTGATLGHGQTMTAKPKEAENLTLEARTSVALVALESGRSAAEVKAILEGKPAANA